MKITVIGKIQMGKIDSIRNCYKKLTMSKNTSLDKEANAIINLVTTKDGKLYTLEYGSPLEVLKLYLFIQTNIEEFISKYIEKEGLTDFFKQLTEEDEEEKDKNEIIS